MCVKVYLSARTVRGYRGNNGFVIRETDDGLKVKIKSKVSVGLRVSPTIDGPKGAIFRNLFTCSGFWPC